MDGWPGGHPFPPSVRRALKERSNGPRRTTAGTAVPNAPESTANRFKGPQFDGPVLLKESSLLLDALLFMTFPQKVINNPERCKWPRRTLGFGAHQSPKTSPLERADLPGDPTGQPGRGGPVQREGKVREEQIWALKPIFASICARRCL